MSHSFHLYQLQKIDTQLDQGTARILEIKAKIDSDNRVTNAETGVAESLASLKAAQAHLAKIEQEAAAKRMKLEQSESTLYGGKVKVPKELQDLQHEVASLKRVVAGLEDQQLEAMMQVEEAQASCDAANKHLIHKQGETTSENAVWMGENGMLTALKARLQIERDAIVNQIDPVYLEEYARLRKNKRGVAVATLSEDTCSACGSLLTAADRQNARSPIQVSHCPSCGRFLYGG
ncbi:MAG TPA: hypothetical protein DCP32_13495 [Anaerolineaceae bacterium]|nr:MAG: hypothetical protein A2X24_00615 [Chloroflexi bacterium GWB2_54_36]HAL17711.1 hypothetical protein [Anaerolineaceae bacterium]HBA91792.1 hypothetical protein [Anaerolineaceae bacterium]